MVAGTLSPDAGRLPRNRDGQSRNGCLQSAHRLAPYAATVQIAASAEGLASRTRRMVALNSLFPERTSASSMVTRASTPPTTRTRRVRTSALLW